MNNKGFFRLIGLIAVIALIAGSGYFYFKLIGNGVQVGTGDVAIDITLSKGDKSVEDNQVSNKENSTNQTINGDITIEEIDSSSPPGHPSS